MEYFNDLRTIEMPAYMYPYTCIYLNKRRVFIWISSAVGGDFFKKDKDTGMLLVGTSLSSLKENVEGESSLVAWEENTEMNFDKFWMDVKYLRNDRPCSSQKCQTLLEGWNFLEDLARTVGREKDTKRLKAPILRQIYNKIFYGNNLPSVTPESASYNPILSREEINIFRQEMRWAWNEFFPRDLFV